MDPLTTPDELRSVEPEEITASDLAPYMPRGMSTYCRSVVPAFPLPAPAAAHAIAGIPSVVFRLRGWSVGLHEPDGAGPEAN